jgi:Transcription factor WhiB
MNWRDDALCRSADPELFFPIAGQHTDQYRDQVRRAKLVCYDCPVRESCLEDGLTRIPIGVLGGMDEYERMRLRRVRGLEEKVKV